MGFKCAEIASNVASKALESDDINLLKYYPKKYSDQFKKELKVQLMVHKVFKSLTDSDLEFMFRKLKEDGAEDIISHYGDMDTQSALVKEMFKRGILFSILPKMLSRGISSHMEIALVLSKEHPTLPRAEVLAVLECEGIEYRVKKDQEGLLVLDLNEENPDNLTDIIRRLAFTHEVFHVLIETDEDELISKAKELPLG